MTYTIHPGKHYSTPWRLRIYLWRKRWQWTCKFVDVRHKPDGSTHKLVGVGCIQGHHKESARVGWRYEQLSDTIQLYAYIYHKGVRRISYLTSVEHGEVFDITISYALGVWRINGRPFSGDCSWLTYGLGFYYGGSLPSPNLIKSEIR